MRANSIRRLITLGSTQNLLQRGHPRTFLVPDDCAASTSGRLRDFVRWTAPLGARPLATVPGDAPSPEVWGTAADGAAPPDTARSLAASQKAAAKPSLAHSSASTAPEVPFYVDLAKRYPDPDTIPEVILQKMRIELFGRPVRERELTGRRVLARPLQGRVLADWYFRPPSELPGFHNEEREYKLSKELNRRHRKEDKEDEEVSGGKKKK